MNNDITINAECVGIIREALLIGLTSFGAIEEATNACEAAELCGRPWPEEARPIHPTGTSDTASRFADALLTLHYAEKHAAREVQS
jgi:hypothetical protein